MSQENLKFLAKNGAATWALLVQNGVNWIGATGIFWNNSLGRLGIGPSTDTPTTTLHVNSGTTGDSGFRLQQLINTTTPTQGLGPLGVDNAGKVGIYQGPRIVFDGARTTTYTINTSATVVVYATATTNVGTCYNTSTGLFTPPVNGLYLFAIHNQYSLNGGASTTTRLVVGGTTKVDVSTKLDAGTLAANGNQNSDVICIPVFLTTAQTVNIQNLRTGTVAPLFGTGQHILTITQLA